jgi:hypothetical protein
MNQKSSLRKILQFVSKVLTANNVPQYSLQNTAAEVRGYRQHAAPEIDDNDPTSLGQL